jgi:glycosyltransferase involved in cell wall biosynthesis
LRPKALVLTTVHTPDDTRIRERLIRTLAEDFDVTYACRRPGPSDTSQITIRILHGGRLRRNVSALVLALTRDWDVLILHDPETIPAGLASRLLRRRPVVFDVHEDLPTSIEAKEWVPPWAKPLLRAFARALFWAADRGLVITLAEGGYARLFKGQNVVFPNYPRYRDWPDVRDDADGSAIYVGDVRVVRGAREALSACLQAGLPLKVVGPVESSLGVELSRSATESPASLSLYGRLPNPEALRLIGEVSVGLSLLRAQGNYVESLPTKTLEYLAMGVPVVATDLPGTREVIGGLDAVWLVPPQDLEATAAALREARTRKAKEQAVRQAPRIRAEYAWPEEQVIAFYSGLVR